MQVRLLLKENKEDFIINIYYLYLWVWSDMTENVKLRKQLLMVCDLVLFLSL